MARWPEPTRRYYVCKKIAFLVASLTPSVIVSPRFPEVGGSEPGELMGLDQGGRVLQEFLWFLFGLAVLAAVLASFPGLAGTVSSGSNRRGRRKSPVED